METSSNRQVRQGETLVINCITNPVSCFSFTKKGVGGKVP